MQRPRVGRANQAGARAAAVPGQDGAGERSAVGPLQAGVLSAQGAAGEACWADPAS